MNVYTFEFINWVIVHLAALLILSLFTSYVHKCRLYNLNFVAWDTHD